MDIWKTVSHSDLVPLDFSISVMVLCSLAIIHAVLIHFILMKVSKHFKDRRWHQKAFHILANMITILPTHEWDHDVLPDSECPLKPQSLTIKIKKYWKEIKTLLLLFFLENLVLCTPIWILWGNINKRNSFLDKFFPQLPEEKLSTMICAMLGAVLPILHLFATMAQYVVLNMYHKIGHPWHKLYQAFQQ